MAKGFGGKYFSLQAITATVNAVTLHNHSVRTRTCHTRQFLNTDDSADESPPDVLELLLESTAIFTPKSFRCRCFCNCFFRRKTARALFVSSLIPKLRFLFRYFHTDTSPPLRLFISL